MEIVFTQLENFMKGLDWTYMITFILIAWTFTRDNALESWWKEEKFPKLRSYMMATPKGVRVLIIGIFYTSLYYHLFDLPQNGLKQLFSSFVFAVAFHTIFIKAFERKAKVS